MTKPIPAPHPCRPLLLALVGILLLASCAGADDEEGVATARGVNPTFCRAFGDMRASAKDARAGGELAGVEQDVRDGLERDIKAVLKVVPEDAPGEVAVFLEALRKMVEFSKVWGNPATGGIKEEYVDDALPVLAVVAGDESKAVDRFVAERCSGTATASDGALSGLAGSTGRPSGGGASPRTAAPRPATVRVLLDDGPAGVYERVKVDVGRVTATDAAPTTVATPGAPATGSSSLLIDVDLTATTSAANAFSADDFRLERPGGRRSRPRTWSTRAPAPPASGFGDATRPRRPWCSRPTPWSRTWAGTPCG